MAPSAVQEKSLPNVAVVTTELVSANSCVLVPSRERLLWYVRTPERSVTATGREAEIAPLETLVAVIV